MFLLYLHNPEIQNMFALYTNGTMWFVFGLLKGCNWGGKCRKCGKYHGPHPTKGKPMSEEQKRKISKANKGKKWKWTHVSPFKGIPRTEEVKCKISRSLSGKPSKSKGRKLSEEHKKHISEALTGQVGYWRGKVRPLLTKIKIRLSLLGKRKSPEHKRNIREAMRKYWNGVHTTKLRKIYNIPENIQFIPVTVYEHYFARKVLIEGGYSYGLITQSRLRERQEWLKNNQGEREVPVVT